MVAGAQNELVGEMLGSQNRVQLFGAGVETVAVLIAAVEVELQVGKPLGMLGEGQGVVGIEISFVQRRAEGFLQHLRVKSPAAFGGKGVGKFCNQRRAVGAGGAENVRMPHGKVQRAIAPHGDAADSAGLAACNGAILAIDRGTNS